MKALVLATLLTIPGQASTLEVHGTEESFFQNAPRRQEVEGTLEKIWEHVSQLLSLSENDPGPVVYLYPFRRAEQPTLLLDLQDKILADVPGYKENPAKFERVLYPVIGITYDSSLFHENSPLRGRVIQVNPDRSFLLESSGNRGYGLYLTAHEMVHYALNRRGVDPKFHHCLMIQENEAGNGLLLNVLREGERQGWAGASLQNRGPNAQGYGEERRHCDRDQSMVRQQEGASGLASFWEEIHRLAERFVKEKP